MDTSRCTGWWEQNGIGRVEMEGLTLVIEEQKISGGGYDSVGMFTFEGKVNKDGDVHMIKQYLGKHRVLYKGEYDGASLLWGVWSMIWDSGPWEIRFRQFGEQSEKATEKMVLEETISQAIVNKIMQ